jgi:hypothetical protein
MSELIYLLLCLTVNKVQYIVLIHNRMHSIKIKDNNNNNNSVKFVNLILLLAEGLLVSTPVTKLDHQIANAPLALNLFILGIYLLNTHRLIFKLNV